MDANQAASLTALLAPVFGVKTAGVVSLLVLVKALLPEAMPYLPVADNASPAWYRIGYGVLARITGSWRNNAPLPPSGNPAGGIVPTPPSMKKDTSNA
jgi:hypothetical protein